MKVETIIKVVERDIKKWQVLADDAPCEDTKNFCLNRIKVYKNIVDILRKE